MLQTSQPSDEISPELMRYLDRDYWEKKEKEKAELKAKSLSEGIGPTSTGILIGSSKTTISSEKENPSSMANIQHQQIQQTLPPALAAGASNEELDEFVTTLRTQVEIFVNRMKSNSSRGRSITNDSSVQTLFMNTMAMHSKLLKHIQDQEDKRVYYEGLQDKLTQVKDARAALDALREEERERKRREAEEAERLRQIQMREKLEVMRKKKQEYLQYQRQVALQRMQEQEMEMKLRQEQVKQQYAMNIQQTMGYPPNMYGQPPMAQHSGMYPGMPMHNPTLIHNQQQGPYLQQFAPPPGQHPMQYQPGPPMPQTQQQPSLSMVQPGQLPLPGQSNPGVSVTASEIPPTTTAVGGNDPPISVPPSAGNGMSQPSAMPGNMQGLHSNIMAPLGNSGDIQHAGVAASFNMTPMASALPPQTMSNPYNSQQPTMQLGQGQQGGALSSSQQVIPQQGNLVILACARAEDY